ncbi:RNA-directed DNA polymerase, partial [Striga asiatica]
YFPSTSIFAADLKQNSSWIWRSLWKVRELLKEGLQIDIRNGATVRLQDFNWIPGIKGRYPHLKNPPATGKLWVKDLIQRDNGQWDELRLRELIEEEDCREILKIQTLDPLLDDKWSWKMGVKVKELLKEGLQIDIRNGATVRLQDFNWIPGIKGRCPHLKNPPATGKLWVKELIQRDNGQWDELRLRELIEEEDCREILKIQTLDPLLDDKWSWKMGVKDRYGTTGSALPGKVAPFFASDRVPKGAAGSSHVID